MSWFKDRREDVLRRDNHCCKICKSKENLHAHHIIPRELNGTDSIENLITLCASCHRLIHSKKRDNENNNTDRIEVRKILKNNFITIPKRIVKEMNIKVGDILEYKFITQTKFELFPEAIQEK